MNRLESLRYAYETGKYDKLDYIARIHEMHMGLFDYPALMQGDSDVAAITILPDGIAVRSRSQQIEMFLDPADQHLVPYTLLNFRHYETEETAFLKAIVGHDWTVFDIGANCGWYSLVLARQSAHICVHAFEPIPSTCELLRRNIVLNGLDNIHVHKLGISDCLGSVDFLYTPSCSGATSLKQVGQPAATEKVSCQTTSIDDFCREKALVPKLVKCDIEGAELLALKGGLKTIAEARPVLLFELLRKWSARFDYHPNDVFSLLHSLGYGAYTAGSSVLHPCPLVSDDTAETNFIFLHQDEHKTIIDAWVQTSPL